MSEDARPFPNEHAARLENPDKYDSFARQNNKGGDGVDFIFGVLPDGKTELQAIRFDKKKFTPAEARDWLKKHDFKPIQFEEASERAAEASDEFGASCPVATHDDAVNMQNHLICIEQANLGPADPNADSNEFWAAKATLWNVSDAEARVMQCQNCEYYKNSPKMLDCIKSATLKASDLPVEPKWADVALPSGYCTKWDITCTSTRSCDTWEKMIVVSDDSMEDTVTAPEPAPEAEIDPELMSMMSGERSADITDIEVRGVDTKKRTVDIAVSSELPVDRSFGKEILVHEAGAIDMGFIASGRAPLLLDHDMEKQIGVIESVELSADRKLRAKVRFGRSALAQEVFQDVADGIRSNISVGYRVHKMERSPTSKDEYLVSSWSPIEVSVVSVPADPSVGVNRSAAALEPKPTVEPSIKKEDKMSDEVNLDAVRAEAAAAAARNAADIVALGARHNASDLAQKALAEGRSIDQFRGELLEKIGNKPLENKEVGLTNEERKSFSLVRAINALANPTDRRAQEAAAFEFEASRAAATAYGVTAQGLMIPAEVLGNWKRDLTVGTNSAGGYTVATDLLASEFIDVLRNASSVMQAGARMMPGLVGNIAIPKKTAASTAGWISSEGGAASETAPTFGQVTLSPKTLGAFSDVTRKLLMQSSLSIESLIRDDLTNALALKIDSGALEGDGSSGAPTGVLGTSGVNKPSSFAAAVPTFAEVVALETYVNQDNALLGNLAYITDAGTFGGLKTTKKDAGSGEFVAGPDGRLNGYNTIVSNQATAGNVYFGNWADLLIGMWGGLDITVDPYTASTTGTVRIVALQSVDVAVRHAESFAYNNDGV